MDKLGTLAKITGKGFEPGQTVFKQGDPGDAMYIIQTGKVDVLHEQDGAETLLASLGPGEFFGEMALVDDEPRSATLRAAEHTTLVPITRDFLFRYARKDTSFVILVLESLSTRLAKTDKLLLEKYASMETIPLSPEELKRRTEPKSVAFLKSFTAASDPSLYIKKEQGSVVFRQDEPGDVMYIILEGSVRISQQDEGNMFALAELGRGDFFGEMALISGHKRSATATTTASSVLMPVNVDYFASKAKADPDVVLHLIQILILRLRYVIQALTK